MNINEFDYDLPEELIAQKPLKNRSDSKLMVLDRNDKTITHDEFKNIDNYLSENDVA